MIKERIDQIAVQVTDALAGEEGSIGDAARIIKQILAGCEAHVENLIEMADEDCVKQDIKDMLGALYAANLAVGSIKAISDRTGGAL